MSENGAQTTYTKENGDKLQGMQKVNVNGQEGVYYFNDDASLYCGWMKDENNNFHYFGADGKMEVNRYIGMNNHIFSINEKGELNQNDLTLEEKQFILEQSKVQLQSGEAIKNDLTDTWSVQITNPITGEKELARGLTKLVQEDGINTYYFDDNGNMLLGLQFINNMWMFFNLENGRLEYYN